MEILECRDRFGFLARKCKPDNEFHVLLTDKAIDEAAQFHENRPAIGRTTTRHEKGIVEIISAGYDRKARSAVGNQRANVRMPLKSRVHLGEEVMLQDHRVVIKEED